MNKDLIPKIFILSGLINIGGVLLFSQFFSSNVIAETYPAVMSNFGLLMIMVWGLIFIGAASQYSKIRSLIGVFVLEKLIYAISWGLWFSPDKLHAVYEQDIMAGIFYTIYGGNDFLFFLFFAWLFWDLRKK